MCIRDRCGKTNVLTYAFNLWERTFYEVAEDYPDIQTDYSHVDAIAMWMVKNPEYFDVIVTDNLFGDIITDLGAVIQGGMGIAAGGNIKDVYKRQEFILQMMMQNILMYMKSIFHQ